LACVGRAAGCTEAGSWAVRRIALARHPWSDRIAALLGADELPSALRTMQALVAVLDADRSAATA
jgi:hypothetical protein